MPTLRAIFALLSRQPALRLLACLAFAVPGTSASLAQAPERPPAGAPTSWTGPDGSYQDSATNTCQNAPTCIVTFEVIPKGKELTVTNASCYIDVFRGNAPYQVYVGAKRGSSTLYRFTFLPYSSAGSAGMNNFYLVNSSAAHLVFQGENPLVTVALVSAANTIIVKCTVAGTLKP